MGGGYPRGELPGGKCPGDALESMDDYFNVNTYKCIHSILCCIHAYVFCVRTCIVVIYLTFNIMYIHHSLVHTFVYINICMYYI